MSKKLLKNPIIFFDFDDSDEEDEVEGSGQGGYSYSYEAWLATAFAVDKDENGIVDWDDYVIWWGEQGFSGEPYHQP